MTRRTSAVVAGLVLAVLAALAITHHSLERRDAARERRARLEEELAALRRRAAARPRLEAERDALARNLASYVRILPAPEVATEERLMETSQARAERAGLAISSWGAR